MCQRIGRSPTGTIGLGRNSVSSRKRVPRPPQKMTTFINEVCYGILQTEASELRLLSSSFSPSAASFLFARAGVATPTPVADLRHVLAVFVDVSFVIEEFVADELLDVSRAGGEAGDAIDDVADEVEAIEIVKHNHVEGSGRCSFFFIAANVKVLVIGAAIGQAMNEPWISVISEDDGFVFGEERVEI